MSEAPDSLNAELSGELLWLTKLSRSLEIYGYLYECFVTAQGKTDSDVVAVISSTTTENPIKSTILGDQLRAAASQYKEIKALEQYLLNQKMSDIRQQSMLLKLAARASLRDSSRDSI